MVRIASIEDAPEIAQVITETWKTAYEGIIAPGYPQKLETNFFSRIMEKNILFERETVYVYEKNNHIIGFISGKKSDSSVFEVIGLYVFPEHQGNGIGQSLFNQIKDFSISENCNVIRLKTLAGAKNNSFYHKNGMQKNQTITLELDGKEYEGIEYQREI